MYRLPSRGSRATTGYGLKFVHSRGLAKERADARLLRAAAAAFNRGCPMYVPTPRLGGLSGRVACSSCAAAPSRAPHALSGTGDEMMFSS